MILTKICSKCGIEKPLNEFNRKRVNKDGRRAECKLCQRKAGKRYYIENADAVNERVKAYREANPDKVREFSKKWENANPQKAKARFLKYKYANLEECRARDKHYRLNNLDKDAAKTAKRRAAKRKRTPPWLTIEHLKEIETFYTEARELTESTGVEYHVDHIMPLNGATSCGLHVPWNLQVITAEENLKKGNKIPC